MQITRSRHLPDTHNHQLSELSSRPIEIEHEIEIEMEMEMQLEIAIRNRNSHRNCGKYAKYSLLTLSILQYDYVVFRA